MGPPYTILIHEIVPVGNTTQYNISIYDTSTGAPTKLLTTLNTIAGIPLYSLIFVSSVIGNVMVITTLLQNKRMRTVTNMFLLNLSLADLLLAVFCMPFTIIPILMRDFIFGATTCVLIRYLQGVSVGVSCFTLVAISVERYFAICQPLKSRSWQTLSHSYITIAICWILAFFIMIPLAIYNKLLDLSTGRHKCLEDWDNTVWKHVYTIILDLVLLVFPILIMSFAYGKIAQTLWRGIKYEKKSDEAAKSVQVSEDDDETETIPMRGMGGGTNGEIMDNRARKRQEAHRPMRQSNTAKSRAAKKRVIRMLFAIVLEFFICWTPLYIVTTWIVFDVRHAKQHISPMVQSFIYLLSYVSSCCNPITYCFMHKKFRQGFMSICRSALRVRSMERRRSQYSSYSGHSSVNRTGTIRVSLHENTKLYSEINDSESHL